MPTFYESDSSPIASELVRQGFTLDRGEVLRIVDIDERAAGTDTAVAIGTAAISLVAACGTLALSGFTLPILAPIAALGFAGLTAWNSRVVKQEREFEAEFLHNHPEFIDAVNRKLNAGEEGDRVAAAYEHTLKAFIAGDTQRMQSFLPAMAPYPVEPTAAPATLAATAEQIGNATRFGAVEVPAVAPSQEQVAASPAGQTNDLLPTNKTELLDRLKTECPGLLRLIKSQPIRAVGTQRTGKTTLVKKLSLLRMLLLQNHSVIASTPHDEPDNRYPSVFQIVGWKNGKRDYAGIETQWDAMAQRIEDGDRSSITTVWDEFGLFNKVMEEEKLTSVLTSSLREATKHGEFPVFIVHGETQAFLPGSRGLVTVFLSSTVRVETIGELVTGADGLDEMKPTGKFKIKWLDGNIEEGQLPGWLTEEFLISLLPESTVRRSQLETHLEKPAATSPQSELATPKIATTPQDLNRMFSLPSADHEVEEAGAEQQDTTAIDLKKAFPSWNDKTIAVALKVVRLLQKTPDKTFKAHEVKSNTSELKKVDPSKTKDLLGKLVDGGFIQAEGEGYSAIVPSNVSDNDEFNW